MQSICSQNSNFTNQITELNNALDTFITCPNVQYTTEVAVPANSYNITNEFVYQAPEGYYVADFSVVNTGNHMIIPFGHDVKVYNEDNRQYTFTIYLSSLLSYEVSVLPIIRVALRKKIIN